MMLGIQFLMISEGSLGMGKWGHTLINTIVHRLGPPSSLNNAPSHRNGFGGPLPPPSSIT